MSFFSHLEYVLGDRRLTPWGKALGLSSGTLANLGKNNIPGGEILALIQRMENASISWLLDGSGSPFIVANSETSEELQERLEIQLADEGGWKVHVLDDPFKPVFVLELPAEYDYKGKTIPYSHIEIETGPWSPELMHYTQAQCLKTDNQVQEAMENYNTSVPRTSDALWSAYTLTSALTKSVRQGQMGTYQLFKGGNHKWGVLGNRGLDRDTRDHKWLYNKGLPQTSDKSITDIDLMRAVIVAVDKAAEKQHKTLSSLQKAKVITAAYRRAYQGWGASSQLDTALIESLVEIA